MTKQQFVAALASEGLKRWKKSNDWRPLEAVVARMAAGCVERAVQAERKRLRGYPEPSNIPWDAAAPVED